jgi:hypothetical protein
MTESALDSLSLSTYSAQLSLAVIHPSPMASDHRSLIGPEHPRRQLGLVNAYV